MAFYADHQTAIICAALFLVDLQLASIYERVHINNKETGEGVCCELTI